MRVSLLGPLEVTVEGRPCAVAGGRLRALLARLAVAEGRTVSTAELVDAVWPGDPPVGGANALQSLVSRLRRALGGAESVLPAATGYRLAVTRPDLDFAQLCDLVRRGQRRLDSGAPADAIADLDRALQLWRGEPLVDAGTADYALGYRSSWHALRLRAAEGRVTALLRIGRFDDAVTDAAVLASELPLNERVSAGLIEALAGAGRGAEALATYELLRTRLRDELGTDPGAELQALHLRLLRRSTTVDSQRSAPTTPAAARRTNLRAALTSFVGREDDLERVLDGIRGHRLTTLLGVGGCGKTRLAVESARRLLSQDQQISVWMVELAAVTATEDIAAAVLGTLGLRDTRVTERSDRPGPDARDRLLDRLRDSRCLLVMDNCEHLIDGVASLVDDILAVAPEVRVLATSRELLGLTGERLCAVAPLALPPVDVGLADAPTHPAVRLWQDRATAVQPAFTLQADSLPVVVEIIRRLDGLPLAIELAAARLRMLPVREIADRLSDRFRLLTGGNRTSLPRHRTLHAVVEWSWELLTPAERLLAERLSVFPAGADVDGVVLVCADDQLLADDIDGLLASLVDKSLIQSAAPPPGAPLPAVRYRMLETIREYGIERLAERDELAAARLAHADYYAKVVLQCEPVLRSREQLAAMARLDLDRENVATALRHLADTGHGAKALTVMLALAWYWAVLDNTSEMIGWAELILQANAGSDVPGLAYARAALVMVDLTSGPGQGLSWDEMRQRLGQIAVELAAAEPPFPGLQVLRCLIASFAGMDDLAESMLQGAGGNTDPWVRAAVQAARANLYENTGELERMRVAVDGAYEQFLQLGDRWGLSTTLVARAQLATVDGRLDDALRDYQEARRHLEEMGPTDEDAYISVRITDALMRLGNYDAARAELVHLQRASSPGMDTERTLFRAAAVIMIDWHTGQQELAVEQATAIRAELAARDGSAALIGHLRGVILASTALVAAWSGDLAQAADDLTLSYPAAVQTMDQPILAAVGTAVAGWLAVRGRAAEAAAVLGAAASVRGADDPTDRTISLITEQLRGQLGERFDAAYDAGRRLDRAEAQSRLDPARYG